MSSFAIPRVKKVIRSFTIAQAREVAEKTMEMENPAEIREYMNTFLGSVVQMPNRYTYKG